MTDIVEQLRDPKLDHDCLHRLSAADIIESLRQQLSECREEREWLLDDVAKFRGERNALREELAECQAREKVLRRELFSIFTEIKTAYDETDKQQMFCEVSKTNKARLKKALAIPSDSTALDTLKKQWQREALLEAADWADNCGERLADSTFSGLASQYRRMAKELE